MSFVEAVKIYKQFIDLSEIVLKFVKDRLFGLLLSRIQYLELTDYFLSIEVASELNHTDTLYFNLHCTHIAYVFEFTLEASLLATDIRFPKSRLSFY